MNLKHLLTSAVLCICASLSAQIKIGDNPQNLDATSVLELESNDRVLVITRISEAQMNSLVPLQGAMVYNIDAQCIFYFDGTAWVNLCDSLGLNFTTDPIVNSASTIVITENGDNVNFEVGEISSENILDFSINSIDIQNNSITADKLAPDSVGSEELQDNTVTDAEIDYNLVTLNDFINDTGFITSADIVSGNANNAITDNGGAFYDDSQIISDIAANTAAIAADGDTSATNELQSLSISGDQLTITNGNTVTIPSADGSDTNIQGGTNINVTGIGTAGNPYLINNTFAEVDGSISNELQDLQYNPGTNILTLTNPATPGNQVDLSALAGGGGTDDQIITDFSLNGGTNELSITIEDGNTQLVDLSSLATGGTDDQNLLAATLSPANVLQIDIENGTSATVDLSSLAGGGGTDDQVAAEVPYDPTASGLVATDTQAAIDEIAASGSTDDQIAIEVPYDPTTSGLIATDTQAAIDEIAASGNTDDQNLTAATLSPANILQIDIENGNSASVDLSSLAAGGGVIVSSDTPNSITTGTDGGALYADPDNDAANEIQDLSEVLTEGADANATVITNLADPIVAQDAATKAYVDAQVGGVVVSTDVPNSIIAGTDGGALYADPDNDAANEIQDLSEVLTEGADANATVITNLADPIAAQDAATKAYVDANVAGHSGTPNSIFFADGLGIPTEDNAALYWDPNGRTFFGGSTGALYIGMDGNPQSDKTKVHIGEDLNTAVAYPLQLQNFGGGLNIGTSVGVLFSVDDADTFGKGALVYERNLTNSRGDFHFLQDQNANADNPDLADAVVTIQNNGSMGINTIAPTEKLHINGNLRLQNQFLDETNSAGTPGDVLTATATGTAWVAGGAGGQVNTASNVGVGGEGLYLQKTGVNLEFKSINAGSNKITITNDTGNNEIDIDVDESNFAISGGPSGVIVANTISQGDIGDNAIGSAELQAASVGTSELEDISVTPAKIEPGANGAVLKTVSGVVTWTEPSVVAMGKANGGIGIELNGAAVSSGGAGMNTVTLNNARPDGNYIIQLSVSGDNRIYVTSQVAGSFTVEIRENSTGNLTSAVWFFTVLDF